MSNQILLVDDDPNILSGYKRSLRKKFDVHTALGGEPALEIISNSKTFAVIVSDMAMPGMDGIQFLSKAMEVAPDSVRIMLTGHANQDTAIKAVNDGNIFRFLTKPCPDDIFLQTLEAGVKQFQLITAEREILEKTLNGSINILTEILSVFHPDIFGHAMRLKDSIHKFAKFLNVHSSWEMEIAAMLYPIGYVGIPPEVIVKVQKKEELSEDEREILSLTPEIGAHLLVNIPRLEPVSRIIYYQNKRYDGTGFPKDSVAGDAIPSGARLLKILSDWVQLESDGTSRNQALSHLKSREGWYDPKIYEKFSTFILDQESTADAEPVETLAIPVEDLMVGHVLRSDIETTKGELLLSAGQRISLVHLKRLRNYAKLTGIKEPVQVEIPASKNPAESS